MPDEYEDSGPPPTLPPAPKARRAHRRTRPIANAAADAAAANPGAPLMSASSSADEREYRISADDLEGGAERRERVTRPRSRESSRNPVTQAAVRVSRWPTPGGMLGIGLALIVLLFLLIPVNGKRTRAHLLFDALMNLVRLPGVAYPENDGFGFVDAAAAANAASPAGQPATGSGEPAPMVQPNTGATNIGAGVPLASGDLGGWGEVGDGFDDIAAYAGSNGRGDPYGAFSE